jgi:hypothetical protein
VSRKRELNNVEVWGGRNVYVHFEVYGGGTIFGQYFRRKSSGGVNYFYRPTITSFVLFPVGALNWLFQEIQFVKLRSCESWNFRKRLFSQDPTNVVLYFAGQLLRLNDLCFRSPPDEPPADIP